MPKDTVITQEEWDKLPDEYKLVRSDGQHMMLKQVPQYGTCLVPVTVKKAKKKPAEPISGWFYSGIDTSFQLWHIDQEHRGDSDYEFDTLSVYYNSDKRIWYWRPSDSDYWRSLEFEDYYSDPIELMQERVISTALEEYKKELEYEVRDYMKRIHALNRVYDGKKFLGELHKFER